MILLDATPFYYLFLINLSTLASPLLLLLLLLLSPFFLFACIPRPPIFVRFSFCFGAQNTQLFIRTSQNPGQEGARQGYRILKRTTPYHSPVCTYVRIFKLWIQI